MTKRLSTIIIALIASLFISLPAMAQMTDEAVYNYVKEGLSNGKSQDVLVKELVARGVTKEQAMRIQQTLQGKGTTGAIRDAGVQERTRRMTGTMVGRENETMNSITGQLNEMPDSLFKDSKVKTIEFEGETYVLKEKKDSIVPVFGHNIFSNPELTFAPNENLATPENYKLGPGDEVIIDIWGTNQNTIRQTISPDGFINVEGIGLVYLTGMTVKEADKYMRQQLNKIYSVAGDGAQSDIKLTLGALRTIQVNVMGEVKVPGTYFLSSLSSVYHALYRAGGFTDLGSLRNIELIRNGQKIVDVDVYDFIVKGQSPDDVTLQDGDIILVPTYEMIVDVAGNVKRPMKYEMKDGETVKSVLDFAGGFKGDAYTANLNLVRRNGREYQVYTVMDPEYASFKLMDADSLTVGTIINRYQNRVEIKGAVYRPGAYQLSDQINTVSKLVGIADGLMGDAFTNRAIIHRERKNFTLEVIAVDLGAILDGSAPDVPLQENDVLYVSSIHDLNDLGSIRVNGEVARPGEFVFADNMTIEDAIIQAGGLLESASTAKVDVSRRIKDPMSNEAIDTLAQTFTFTIKDGFVLDGDEAFVLQPYDQIYVRKSPIYNVQNHVTVDGEVLYPGQYALAQKDMRLSDIVRESGGVTKWAYVRGAKLERQMTDDEKARMESTLDFMENSKDSIDVKKLDLETIYTVGIDLEVALANPGSDADVVLRDGDKLIVPELLNTVKISGNVMYPNTVSYNPNMTVKDYVTMAGGYGFDSKRGRAYIIYMNGTVAKARRTSREIVQPGCEIVVPAKRERENSLQTFLSIASTSSSIATMLATVYNIIK